MWRMNVSASIQNSSSSPLPRATRRARTSRSKRTWSVSVGREGGEVVGAEQRRGARVSARGRARCGHQQRPPALERAARRAARAPGSSRCGERGVAAGVEPVGAPVARQHGDVGGQQRVERARRDRLALVGGDLAPRVDARGRCARRPSACDRARAQHRGQRALELAPDRPPPGWRAQPANRVPSYSIVSFVTHAGDDAGGAAAQTSSRKTISVASAATRAELEDAGVAAGALRVARRDLLEQLVDGELVLAERRQRLPARVQVAALGERDQLLDLGLDRLGLGLGGLDPLVLDDLLAEVRSSALRCAASRLSLWRVFWWRMLRVGPASVVAEVQAARVRASR